MSTEMLEVSGDDLSSSKRTEEVSSPAKRGPAVLVMASWKGGTLKTSLVAGVAAELVARGSRVLAIDFDPQVGLLDEFTGGVSDEVAALGRALKKKELPGVVLVDLPDVGGSGELHVIPGGGIEKFWSERVAKDKKVSNLKTALEVVVDDYDVVLIDTGPGQELPLKTALMAASGVIVPVKPEKNAMRNITQMLKALDKVVGLGNKKIKDDTVFTVVDIPSTPVGQGWYREFTEKVPEVFPGIEILDTVIASDADTAQTARNFGAPPLVYAQHRKELVKAKKKQRRAEGGQRMSFPRRRAVNKLAENYRVLVDELEQRGMLNSVIVNGDMTTTLSHEKGNDAQVQASDAGENNAAAGSRSIQDDDSVSVAEVVVEDRDQQADAVDAVGSSGDGDNVEAQKKETADEAVKEVVAEETVEEEADDVIDLTDTPEGQSVDDDKVNSSPVTSSKGKPSVADELEGLERS